MITLQVAQWRRLGRALFLAAGAKEFNVARVTEALGDSPARALRASRPRSQPITFTVAEH